MDDMSALLMAMVSQNTRYKVFDWDRALEIFKERGIKYASAGLMEDLACTTGEILRDGKLITDSYTYLGSTWATPVIVVVNENDLNDYYECWCYADNEHNPHHYSYNSKWEDRHFKEWEKMQNEGKTDVGEEGH